MNVEVKRRLEESLESVDAGKDKIEELADAHSVSIKEKKNITGRSMFELLPLAEDQKTDASVRSVLISICVTVAMALVI